MANTHRWEQMHQEGNRPWDLIGVTPMLKYFIETEMIKFNFSNLKRILIPGCGQVILYFICVLIFCRKMTQSTWQIDFLMRK